MIRGRKRRSNWLVDGFWYFIAGVIVAAGTALGAGAGWIVVTLVVGGTVWLLDAVLPDPNGAWAWWTSTAEWVQRIGFVIGGLITLGALASMNDKE